MSLPRKAGQQAHVAADGAVHGALVTQAATCTRLPLMAMKPAASRDAAPVWYPADFSKMEIPAIIDGESLRNPPADSRL